MMQIDTAKVAGAEDRTIILEFEHLPATEDDPRRATVARLVEFVRAESYPCDGAWRKTPHGWKRTISIGEARCSVQDRYEKETGRRLALRRLGHLYEGPVPLSWANGHLIGAAAIQYMANRANLLFDRQVRAYVGRRFPEETGEDLIEREERRQEQS